MRVQTNEFGQPVGEAVEMELPVPTPPHRPMVGRSCVVSPLRPADHARALFDAFAQGDGRGWTYLPSGPFASFDEFEPWMAQMQGSTDPLFFVIEDDDGPCGFASYLRITPMSASIEVGYIHFAPRLQRTVAATEAMYLMMRGAFDTGYRRYEWKCDALNSGSRSAAQRLGFTFEGVFRRATVYKGRNRDTAWFSVTDDEWPERRAEFERWLDPSNFDGSGQQRTPLRHG